MRASLWWQPAHGPRERFRIVPVGRAGGEKQVRRLLCVHVFVDRRVRRRSERTEHQQHFVAFDQLARLLDSLGRAVGVVIGNEFDLAAINTAVIIDLLEVAFHRLANDAVSRGRAAIGNDVADLDFRIGRAGIVFFLRHGASGRGNQKSCGNNSA